MSMNEFKNWLAEQRGILDTRRQANLEEKGYKSFWKALEGENNLEVQVGQIPRRSTKGTQYIFRIRAQGQEYDWGINENSPQFRDVLELLALAAEASWPWLPVTIIRTGTGRTDTRYSIKNKERLITDLKATAEKLKIATVKEPEITAAEKLKVKAKK